MTRRFTWGIVFLGLALLTGCAREGVSPGTHSVFFLKNGTDGFSMVVDLAKAAPSQEPLDILLLFDGTSSMLNIIETVRDNSVTIMREVRQVYANSAFGVAALYDYHMVRAPWQLYQDLTTSEETVTAALRRVETDSRGNRDWPEAYCRGLFESRFVAWRPGARRYVVLFGDAPAHDPTFYGKDYGIDPGRDGIAGTADDLFLRDVVTQLAADGITVMTVYDRGPWYDRKPDMDDAIKGFEYMAAETGGFSVPVSSADKVPRAIKAGVSAIKRTPPGVFVPVAYREWATVLGPLARDESGRKYQFPVDLHPPHGTPDGIYRFPLVAMHAGRIEGGEVGRTMVTVRIGLGNLDWRWSAFLLYPLFGAIFVWLMVSHRSGERLYGNRIALKMLARALLLAMVIALPVLVWKLIPEPGAASVPVGPGAVLTPANGSSR